MIELNVENLYWLAECIWAALVENLITGHHCNKILGITEINDVMRPTGNHVDCLDLITTHLEFSLSFMPH